MAKIKPYKKLGNYNWRETRYIDAIVEVIQKKQEADPNFKFKQATTFEELEKMYIELCTEEVPYTETKNNNDNSGSTGEENTGETHSDENTHNATESENTAGSSSDASTDDPFNDRPIDMRAYMTGNGDKFTEKGAQSQHEQNKNFQEPLSFGESFQMPTEENNAGPGTNANQSQGSGQNSNATSPKPNTPAASTNISNVPSDAEQKKKTKRFSKSIVRIVCVLYKAGMVYWTTKDITEASLLKYELEGSIDFNLLLSLENDQQIHIKEFFANEVKQFEMLFTIPDDEQERFADSLAEYMHEKGIKPTPGQDLLVNAAEILGVRAAQGWSRSQQNVEILKELRKITISNQELLKNARQHNEDLGNNAPDGEPSGSDDLGQNNKANEANASEHETSLATTN